MEATQPSSSPLRFSPSHPFRVGYALNRKKTLTFDSRGLFTLPQPSSTVFVPIDLSVPLERQGPFHALLVKLTDSMTRAHYHGDPVAQAQMEEVRRYAAAHRDCVLIDELEAVERVLDRRSVSAAIDAAAIEVEGWAVSCPACLTVTLPTSPLPAVPFGFPVVCKYRQSCGSPSSHVFHIVWSSSQLSELPAAEYFIQQLVPHNGSMYKVYVLGDDSFVIPRPSLPPHITAPYDPAPPLPPPVVFDSQRMTLTTAPHDPITLASLAAPDDQQAGVAVVDAALQRVLHEVSVTLRAVFNLTLFGYDVVLPVRSAADGGRRLVIVDVNYFPSYNKVDELSGRLLRAIRDKYKVELSTRQQKAQ